MAPIAPHRGRAVDTIWRPEQLPPRAQIRTDGTTYAIYLPLSITDPTPWHIVSDDHSLMRTVTHAVVHSPSWRVLPTLLEILRGQLVATPGTAGAAAEPRLFFPGDPCPNDLAAVITPDQRIWEAAEWRAQDASISWDDLLNAYKGAIEVPVHQLMVAAYAQQQRRLTATTTSDRTG